jgi:Mg-chelatase subunit ChlD
MKSTDLQDCEVSAEWQVGDCSVSCDDEMEGGTRTLKREISLRKGPGGMNCPQLNFIQKCGKFPCPLNCDVSEWSGWSKCSADCDTGSQSRSRDILQEPKFGGLRCEGVEEVEKCNEHSCDVDCVLERFSKFGPCTSACGGGYQEKRRALIERQKGKGTCPGRNSPERRKTQDCNDQPCVGDEICKAKMDLILAVDSSGSVGRDHFRQIQNLTAELLKRFQKETFGQEGMKVGLVQFGNGFIEADGTISPAVEVAQLSSDMPDLEKKVLDLKHKRGFTNFAQAMLASKRMLGQDTARKDAQSAVIVITDGTPSFNIQSIDAAEALDKTGAKINIVAIRDTIDDEMKFLEKLVTTPTKQHLIRVAGFQELKTNVKGAVNTVLAKTCPDSESPKARKVKETVRGFELVHEGKDCPCWWHDLTTACPWKGFFKGHRCKSANQCFRRASEAQADDFVFGKKGWFKGKCYTKSANFHDGQCKCKHWWTGAMRDNAWSKSNFNHYKMVEKEV